MIARDTLPADFLRTIRQPFRALYEPLVEGLRGAPGVSIRLNPRKVDVARAVVTDAVRRVPWADGGYVLRERPDFTFDPMLHAGAYYVQEAASMFVGYVTRQLADGPVLVLDLCAAPGGKSTAVSAALPDGSLLLCNETIRGRANVLDENICKWGDGDVIVTNDSAQAIARANLPPFDIVIADVPCSGEGMFRKDPAAAATWSVAGVARCARLQRDIIAAIWPSLRDGGILIYSTCTFNTTENEANAEWIATELGADFVHIDVPNSWHIQPALVDSVVAYRFIPGLTEGEGLFVAVLRKHATGTDKARKKATENAKKAAENADIPLNDSTSYCLRELSGRVIAVKRAWAHIYDAVAAQLRVLHAGIALHQRRGKDVVPEAALALASALNRNAFPSVEVGRDTAISYLRRESITLPATAERGYVLLTYRNLPIGFVKNIGNRANNLYPQEWRIRSTHVPEAAEIITI